MLAWLWQRLIANGDSDGLNLSQDKNEKSFLNSPFFIGWGPAPKPPGFFEAYPSCVF
jgi:hypothetical protein